MHSCLAAAEPGCPARPPFQTIRPGAKGILPSSDSSKTANSPKTSSSNKDFVTVRSVAIAIGNGADRAEPGQIVEELVLEARLYYGEEIQIRIVIQSISFQANRTQPDQRDRLAGPPDNNQFRSTDISRSLVS